MNTEAARFWAEKESLTAALVEEQQRGGHSLWGCLLVLAFYPMLSKLRHRILSYTFVREDVDQLVLSTFIEIVREFPLDKASDRLCLRLRQATQRAVFRQYKIDRFEQELVQATKPWDLEHLEEVLLELNTPEILAGRPTMEWPAMKPFPKRSRSRQEEDVLISFLVNHVGDDLEADRLELLIATLIRGERLSHCVRRQYSSTSNGDEKKLYQKIKRRHSRALARLRELLSDFRCPQTDPIEALPPGNPDCSEGGELI